MFVAMSKDIRVIVIKLADRLHNMRTLAALREDRRIFKSRETLEIYAPIAHRLGINSIKWELEDLSFFYLEPNKYKQVSRMVTESRAEREKYLADVIAVLHEEMGKVGISAQIMGRPKHLYSIYQKMTKKGKGFSRDLRPHRRAHHHQLGEGLLLVPGRGAHPVAPHARPLQRLHRHAEVQHVPVAAHHGHRASGASPWRCRSAPRRCTAMPSTAWRPTGATRRPAPRGPAPPTTWTPSWRGCARWLDWQDETAGLPRVLEVA